VRLHPAASAKTGVGPTAYSEMDELRAGIRDVFPEGRRVQPALFSVPGSRLF
jgi:hypothetical protein